ncbi:MAG: hypothetical protein CMA18_006050 [Methanobacteriota archaeon]|nr:MAG: hypothetical protein CMA18_006050 [Euryarchaeota archaeon]|tara:strand:+ start:3203 stop:3580 length:378 start_codon:yes stop_codon:yes gene_type:complete
MLKILDPPPPLRKEADQNAFWKQEDENRSIPMSSTSQGGLPDGILSFFLAINVIFLFTNPSLICCSIVVVVPVLMVNSVVSEKDPSVRKRKIQIYIFLIAFAVYIAWKIFEANCCGYEAYGTVPF